MSRSVICGVKNSHLSGRPDEEDLFKMLTCLKKETSLDFLHNSPLVIINKNFSCTAVFFVFVFFHRLK